MKLHYSQTCQRSITSRLMLDYHMKLHYSQTKNYPSTMWAVSYTHLDVYKRQS